MDDLAPLLEKSIDILRRDITNLFGEVSKGSLPPQRASSLVSYIKVMRDILKDERDNEETLRRLVEEIINNRNPGTGTPPSP